ncbi:MAG: DNA alkylation repair protein [Planctomycetaceae bacterium]|nr:DNA alkylation repair protein [Planctomycetaceae bacterium]
METVKQVMSALKKKGSAQTRKTFARHGAPDNMFGVKIADLKVIAKQIKGNQALAMELYKTGNTDAMYLAGIVADGKSMSKKELNDWCRAANWHMIAEYSLPGVAHENPHAKALASKWIKSKKDHVAAAGWNTYSGLVATQPDSELDLEEIKLLLRQITESIHDCGERVKYTMNGFVISVGGYVKPLSAKAKSTAKRIGTVSVEMGETACKVPLAIDYIAKMESTGRAFKKRKTIKC